MGCRQPAGESLGTHSGQRFLDILPGSGNVAEDRAGSVLLQTAQKEPRVSFLKKNIKTWGEKKIHQGSSKNKQQKKKQWKEGIARELGKVGIVLSMIQQFLP